MDLDDREAIGVVDDVDTTTEAAEKEKLNTTVGTVMNVNNIADLSTFENLLEAVGTNGRWNIIVITTCIFGTFVNPFSTIAYQFLGATPDYWCRVPELMAANWTQEQIIAYAIPLKSSTRKPERCLMYNYNYTTAVQLGFIEAMKNILNDSNTDDSLLACNSRIYNTSQHKSSIVTEWDLTCDRRPLYSTTSSAVPVGVMIGNLFFGHILDMIGRRKSALISSVLTIMISALTIMSPNVEIFIILKMLQKVFDNGYYLAAIIISLELSSPSQRDYVGSLHAIPWALGYMTVPCVAYFVRPWRWLQAALAVPTLYTLVYFWVFPESPRWLILHGRYNDALALLKKAASNNRRTLPPDHVILAAMEKMRHKVKPKNNKRGFDDGRMFTRLKDGLRTMFVLFLTPGLRVRTIIIFYLWMSSAIIYYGVSLNSYNMGTNIYMYTFLGGLLEIPSYVLLWLAATTYGRKKVFLILTLFCGISISLLTTLLLLLQEVPIAVKLILSLSGKMSITAALTLLWYYTPELFPIKYRCRAVGEAVMMSMIATVITPYINDILGEVSVWAPSAIFSLAALVAAALVSLLPETKNRNMEQEHEEEYGDKECGAFTN